MKAQDKTPEQLSEVDTGKLPENEFRVMIVKMIQDLGKRMEAQIEKVQEMFNKKQGFQRWFSGKEPTCNAGDVGLIPWSWRSPGEGNGELLQYSCLGNPMGRGAWWAIVSGVTKSRHNWAANSRCTECNSIASLFQARSARGWLHWTSRRNTKSWWSWRSREGLNGDKRKK